MNTQAITSCLAAGLAALPASSLAQPQQSDNADIEEIVIVGSRQPIPRSDLGSSVSIVDRQALQARQVPIVSKILRDLPGLAVSRTGPVGSQTQVRIRGAEGNHTLVLIDGIEVTDPVGNFEFDFGDLVTTGLERVEVIRGPQSALYGSEAIGGVINIVTRDPEPGLNLEALGEGGSHGTARFGATVSGGTEAVGASVSAGYHDTVGVSASPSGDEEDGYENLTLSGKVIAEPMEILELGAIGRYVSGETEFDTQDFATGRVVDADRVREFAAFYGRTYAKLELFGGAWSHRVSAELTDTDTDNFAEGSFDNSFEGTRSKLEYQTTVDIAWMQVTGAVEHEDLDFAAIGPTPQDPISQDKSDEQTSLVGEWRGEPLHGLSLSAGVRKDFNDTFSDETTWRATAAYELTAATRLHASYGTGVADPTFFDRFGFFPDQFIGNPDLQPESAQGWDIGITQQFMDRRAELDVTFFHSDLEDEIVTSFDPETFLSTVENQPGESERRGVEVTLSAKPLDGLTLDGAYTYLDAEEPDGSREIRRAEHIASFTATYRSPDDRAEVSLDFDYNGEQEDLDFSAVPAERVTLDAFLIATLAGRYKITEAVEGFARVENLLDDDFQNVLGFNTPGAAAFAGLRVRF